MFLKEAILKYKKKIEVISTVNVNGFMKYVQTQSYKALKASLFFIDKRKDKKDYSGRVLVSDNTSDGSVLKHTSVTMLSFSGKVAHGNTKIMHLNLLLL